MPYILFKALPFSIFSEKFQVFHTTALSVRDTGSAWNSLFPLVHTENSLLILQNLVSATFLVKHAHAYVKENALLLPFWVL